LGVSVRKRIAPELDSSSKFCGEVELMLKRLSRAAAVLALVGVGFSTASAQNKNRNLVVVSRNLDTGSDYNLVLKATSPTELVLAVAATYNEIVDSNIPERADAIAAEIQQQQPDLVALQEVTKLLHGPLGGPAETVDVDQLQALTAALELRGVHYGVLASQQNADLELPALDLSRGWFDARVIDFDVVLARTDLPISDFEVEQVTKQHFANILQFMMLGTSIEVPRGWIAVDVKLRGKPYRLVDTHLESINYTIQALQAEELVNGPTIADVPVVLAGDINSDASGFDPVLSASYQILVSAGFLDFWPIKHPGDPGFTNPLHGEDPYTPLETPNQRIDVILVKAGGKGIDVRNVFLIGNTTSDLTAHGLWPSDHAGVVEAFTLLP
jgi:endonuclease/exonuclease/phosphatase family metal-dependent hydrolase